MRCRDAADSEKQPSKSTKGISRRLTQLNQHAIPSPDQRPAIPWDVGSTVQVHGTGGIQYQTMGERGSSDFPVQLSRAAGHPCGEPKTTKVQSSASVNGHIDGIVSAIDA